MTDKEILIFGFILAVPIYFSLWYLLTSRFKIDVPLMPERYHDDPLKTIRSAGLTLSSLILGSLIIFIFSLL